MKKFLDLFTPNKNISKSTITIMVAVQAAITIVLWMTGVSKLLPTPIEIWYALGHLIEKENLIAEVFTSVFLGAEAMMRTIILSLIISYATVLPFFRPLGFIFSKLRFLTLVGLSFVFVLMTDGSHSLKVNLLTFGISVFFVTSLTSIIRSIPRGEFNHARTLRMSEWEVVWHVVILGRMHEVFEVIRQNFAINWMMLTMVEGIARSDGGIGVLLLNLNKHIKLDAVFAIQIVILIIGITQDYIIGFLKNLFCPYANLSQERK